MRKLINNKKGFEMTFSWLFASIAGAVILFLAIYGAARASGGIRTYQYSDTAKQIGNYLNPLSDSSMTKPAEINFKSDTKIYLNCSTTNAYSPLFGKNSLSFSEKTSFFRDWSKPGAEIAKYNKYIFAENVSSGKTLHIFAVPFYTGFRVDSLIMMTMSDYCFINSPEFFKDELSNLELKNINFTYNVKDCKKNSVAVCFGASATGCNMTVFGDDPTYETGTIAKNHQTVSYTKDTIYAAIYADPQIYECNMKRLGIKVQELASIYNTKIEIVKTKNCQSDIGPYLSSIFSLAANMSSSKLKTIMQQADQMDKKDCNRICAIYGPRQC